MLEELGIFLMILSIVGLLGIIADKRTNKDD